MICLCMTQGHYSTGIQAHGAFMSDAFMSESRPTVPSCPFKLHPNLAELLLRRGLMWCVVENSCLVSVGCVFFPVFSMGLPLDCVLIDGVCVFCPPLGVLRPMPPMQVWHDVKFRFLSVLFKLSCVIILCTYAQT